MRGRWASGRLGAGVCAPDAAQRVALRVAVRCRAGVVTNSGAWYGPGSAKQREERRTASGTRPRLMETQQLEQRREVAEFLARGRRGAADEVEDLAVLQAVIGQPNDLAVLVEIDRDHPLVDYLLVHEHHFALGALRDVVKHLPVQRRHRRWRAHHDQHLVLAGADRNLLERAGWQDVALLELLPGAGAEHRTYQCGGQGRPRPAPARGKATRRRRAK